MLVFISEGISSLPLAKEEDEVDEADGLSWWRNESIDKRPLTGLILLLLANERRCLLVCNWRKDKKKHH